MSTRFRPAEHTPDEVLAYLNGTADPVEVGRVLAAERTGLARSEILARYSEYRGGRPSTEVLNGMDG
jgi:hypothetical protein